MSRKGNCWDNAVAESFFSLLKEEMVHHEQFRTRKEATNKIFDYMFAGLPSIVNFAGTTAQMVVADGAGAASQPGSAADLAAKITHYADHPEERVATGRRAREAAFARYDRKMIARQLADVFEEVLAQPQ